MNCHMEDVAVQSISAVVSGFDLATIFWMGKNIGMGKPGESICFSKKSLVLDG